MILQATVERWMEVKAWQMWGVVKLELKGGSVHTVLPWTLCVYLTLGRSPLGYYRVGEDSHLGIFVYETKGNGENAIRPISRGEFDAGKFT